MNAQLTIEQFRLVADQALKKLDLSDTTLPPEFHYSSLPLCVIDAVFSIGVRYESTSKTVKNWCAAQNPRWPLGRGEGEHEHTISEFVSILEKYAAEDSASALFKNRQRTSSRSGIFKSEATLRFAETLQSFRIERFADTLDASKNEIVEQKIKQIPGQGSGISFTYFLMMAGNDEFVKADRMLQRFVGNSLGADLSPSLTRDAVIGAAAILRTERRVHISPRALDYKIWSFQRGVAADRSPIR